MKLIRARAKNIMIVTTIVVLIPALLYWLLEYPNHWLPSGWWTLLGYPLLLFGGYLMVRSAILVYVLQETPLWDLPPTYLVTHGPYRYVRNPMALGAMLVILSEALILRSGTFLGWAVVFMILSHIIAVRVEEPSLRETFGAAYDDYCATTPRWLPTFRQQTRTYPERQSRA